MEEGGEEPHFENSLSSKQYDCLPSHRYAPKQWHAPSEFWGFGF